MSIYKRNSGRWAVMIDADDPMPYRIVEMLPNATNGRRRTRVITAFRTETDAVRALRLMRNLQEERALSVERLARGRRTLGTFKTKKEAEQAERSVLEAKDRGIDVAPCTVTVVDLVERYVENQFTRGECGLKTAEEYRALCRLYVVPNFGGMIVRKLAPAAINEWTVALLRSGGRNGKSLSARSAKHAFSLLRAALRWGVRMQIVSQNVCDNADAPIPARSEARALSGTEISGLRGAAKGTRWEHFIELALMLGARRGELLALTWPDIDIENGRMTIRASLSQTKAATAIKSTKTGRVRMVPLPIAAREVLRRLRVQQNEDRLRAGEIYEVDDRRPLFTDEIGHQLTPKAATNAFARIAKKAGIGTTSLHSTRHTAATQLIAAGIDITTTAAILGHTTPNVTLALYSHVVEGAERSAMDVLADRLEKMRDLVPTIEENSDGNRMATAQDLKKKNPRKNEGILVAGTGFEPVTFGL